MTGLLVINLQGTQAEMGAQHGHLLRAVGGWERTLEFYPELPERLLLGGLGARAAQVTAWLARPIKERLLRELERARPAEYLERSRAFMEALGAHPDEARHLMVMDLFQNAVGLAGRARLGPFSRSALSSAAPACSTVAVWGAASHDGTLRHARNFDFPGIGVWDQAPTVVFCTPDQGLRYGFVTTRGADVPGVTCWNEAGLVLTAHTRFHRDVHFAGAAIVDLGHDIVRRAATLADAVKIARERPVSSSWGLCVSSATERSAIVIETTGARVEVVSPAEDHLTCANRYRHAATQAGEVAASPAWALHSDNRERRLREVVALAKQQGGLSADDLERLLADRVEPEAPERSRGAGAVIAQPSTVQSVVVEPEARVIRVSTSRAPTPFGPYVTLPWVWSDDGGARVVRPDLASMNTYEAPPALAHYVEAARLDAETHDPKAVLAALERAVALDPDDPSYRLLAGALCLRLEDLERARLHFEHGLLHERSPFRRGQLLLWAARTAEAQGQPEPARRLRAELLSGADPRLAALRGAARADQRRRFSRARARRTSVHLAMADLQ